MTTDIINLADYRAARDAARPSPAKGVPIDDAIAICLERPEILTAWEAHFLVSIRHCHLKLSLKQHAVLQRIFVRACGVVEPDNAS
jgi:hypothetical protein